MNEDVTIADVMTREFVGVSESDDLRETIALLAGEGAESAAVVRGTEIVGTVDPGDVFGYLAGGASLDGATVRDVMGEAPAILDADATLSEAVSRLAEGSDRRVYVVEGDEVVGTLTAEDVVAAGVALPAAPETNDVPGPADVSADRTGALGVAETSSQGICEVCGALTQELTTVNGQEVCPDCRDR